LPLVVFAAMTRSGVPGIAAGEGMAVRSASFASSGEPPLETHAVVETTASQRDARA
jgi:hypothetical protein